MKQSPPSPSRKRRRWLRWLLRSLKILLAAVVFYLLLVLVGMWPVNQDFVESENGIEIFVYSSSVHSDLILPIKTDRYDWCQSLDGPFLSENIFGATHVSIGWGDRGFYIETPTWADLKVSTAFKALLFPSESVMHVGLSYEPLIDANTRSVRISESEYERLIDFVNQSFARDLDGKIQLIDGASYGAGDAFFLANGRYHCFQTCNCWTGNALAAAGVKTGWFTPLPRTIFLYFPD